MGPQPQTEDDIIASKLNVNRGTTYNITVNYPSTLVGATVRFTVKSTEYDSDDTDATAILLKNVTNGDSSGNAVITIDPADTQDETPGTYYYDIKVEEAGGAVYKIDEGRFILDGSPTNRLT